MVRYLRVRVKRALQRSGLPDIDYALNPYAGCYHACKYCYAPAYTPYSEAREQWGDTILIKENIAELLQREVFKVPRGTVGVSTITDPYQPVEAREKLTRRSLSILLGAGFRVSIQTKSDMVLRDLDILLDRPELVDVGFTITTARDSLAKSMEPYAPPPSRRIKALGEISDAGLETWVFLGPIIPGYNDNPQLLEEIIETASETGSEVIYDYLRLKPTVAERLVVSGFSQTLVYESRNPAWRRNIERTIKYLCRKRGVKCTPAFPKKARSRSLLNYF